MRVHSFIRNAAIGGHKPTCEIQSAEQRTLKTKYHQIDYYKKERVKYMNQMQVFENPEFGQIRTIIIDDEPWFLGKDVADALGYSNTRDALMNHVDNKDKNTVAIHDGIPGNPNKVIINESGLYSLILGSKLPSATKFKRWVTSEVLPTIRKTGQYHVTGYQPKATSVGEVVNLINMTRQSMKDQGCDPREIAIAVKQICDQFNIHLPDCFIKPQDTSIKDVYHMIDFIYSIPKGKKKPTYEDFVIYQASIKLLKGKVKT